VFFLVVLPFFVRKFWYFVLSDLFWLDSSVKTCFPSYSFIMSEFGGSGPGDAVIGQSNDTVSGLSNVANANLGVTVSSVTTNFATLSLLAFDPDEGDGLEVIFMPDVNHHRLSTDRFHSKSFSGISLVDVMASKVEDVDSGVLNSIFEQVVIAPFALVDVVSEEDDVLFIDGAKRKDMSQLFNAFNRATRVGSVGTFYSLCVVNLRHLQLLGAVFGCMFLFSFVLSFFFGLLISFQSCVLVYFISFVCFVMK
jgi:hypothetical protein